MTASSPSSTAGGSAVDEERSRRSVRNCGVATEFGPHKQVRVNAISAGPILTQASSAIGGIHDMIHSVKEKAPLRRPFTQEEVGGTAAFLASPLASGITGKVINVDAGYCITGM